MTAATKTDQATILVVDDDLACREFLVHLLESEGFRVLSADCATEAIELARKEAQTPDLYVVDFMMPDMYGFDLVHELRRIDRATTTPVIMFTATTRQIEEVVAQEGVTLVHKSTGNRKLLEALRDLLRGKMGRMSAPPLGGIRPALAV